MDEQLFKDAAALGREHGKAAASWFFDGNTPTFAYEHTLKGIREGDPMVMDQLPSSPLSGEFADSLTPAGLVRELGENDESLSSEEWDELCQEYETAYADEVQAEIERACDRQLREDRQDGFTVRAYQAHVGIDLVIFQRCDPALHNGADETPVAWRIGGGRWTFKLLDCQKILERFGDRQVAVPEWALDDADLQASN